MTQNEIEEIESALSISLPDDYIVFMDNEFPVGFRGNADSSLWDCATSVIRRNLELRSPSFFSPWPTDLFFVGDPLTACAYALRLTDNECIVYWLDHCDTTQIDGGQPFDKWAKQVLSDYFS